MNDITTLSKQETKVLTALSTGSLYKEIASDHNISINTVKKHLKNVYRKLQVSKRTQAIEKFFAANTPASAEMQVA
jgi:two-component system, NarL family, response regulator LiaR